MKNTLLPGGSYGIEAIAKEIQNTTTYLSLVEQED
jgi:hypothetical protein